MNAIALRHHRFQGVAQIVRFNWTFYAVASGASALAIVLATQIHFSPTVRTALLIGVGGAMYFVVASLVASFWIYDLSQLMTWRWIGKELAEPPRQWINLHCGLDESTPALREFFPNSIGRAFDIFDPTEMTEPSIHRARTLVTPTAPAESVRYDQLPVDSESIDAAFALLSAHELRHHAARVALFRELRRSLRPGGRVVVAEHLRDAANLLAFGPGFLHFHSAAAWGSAACEAGFVIDREFRITPFVRIFNLRRPS
jgi:SAM-dependent methyltransferase